MAPAANPNTISIEPSAASTSARPGKRTRDGPKGKARAAPTLAVEGDDDDASGAGGGEKKKKKFRHRVMPEEKEEKPDKEIGVSKLKANLRQAKRFLAKVRLLFLSQTCNL